MSKKIFVLLAFIPSLIAADILCSNSKTTCPEDKQCCEVDGEYSCCDPDIDPDVPARRLKVYAGVEITSSVAFANMPTSTNESRLYSYVCDSSNCLGTCCKNSWNDGCCPYSLATCCDSDKCCPASNKCCGDACCGTFQNCCGDGCCDNGYNCCGSWCCKKGYRCGKVFLTCHNTGAIICPAISALILLATSILFAHRL